MMEKKAIGENIDDIIRNIKPKSEMKFENLSKALKKNLQRRKKRGKINKNDNCINSS